MFSQTSEPKTAPKKINLTNTCEARSDENGNTVKRFESVQTMTAEKRKCFVDICRNKSDILKKK